MGDNDAFEREFAERARELRTTMERMAPSRPALESGRADRPEERRVMAGGSRSPFPIGMALLASAAAIVAIVAVRGFGPAGVGGHATSTPTASSAATTVAPTTLAATSPSLSPGEGTAPSPSSVTPTASPASPLAGFTTPGVTGNWSGFAWNRPPAGSPLASLGLGFAVVHWHSGYVAFGQTNADTTPRAAVWTSSDGVTWSAIGQITGTNAVVAEDANGLVAISTDDNVSPRFQTVWKSTDGLGWVNVGQPTAGGSIISLAGTPAGLVAVVDSPGGTGKSTDTYAVEYSSDGTTWSPITVESNLAWDTYAPHVQAGNGRLFLMGTPAPTGKGAASAIWWSDDGRTWTRATGATNWPAVSLAFGRDAIVMNTRTLEIPGASGLSRSTDGGKTWASVAGFAPVGEIVCGMGECSPGPDGVFGGNGSLIVAVKSDGHAWVSYDGAHWTQVAWGGPTQAWAMTVLPRGILVDGEYGAAR